MCQVNDEAAFCVRASIVVKDVPLVLGLPIIKRLNATFDYANGIVAFQIEGNTYKVKMIPTTTGHMAISLGHPEAAKTWSRSCTLHFSPTMMLPLQRSWSVTRRQVTRQVERLA